MKDKIKTVALYVGMPILYLLLRMLGMVSVVFFDQIMLCWFPALYSLVVTAYVSKNGVKLLYNGLFLSLSTLVTCLMIMIPGYLSGPDGKDPYFRSFFFYKIGESIATVLAIGIGFVVLFNLIAHLIRRSSEWSKNKINVIVWIGCAVGVLIAGLLSIISGEFGMTMEFFSAIVLFVVPPIVSIVFARYAFKRMSKMICNIVLWIFTSTVLQSIYLILDALSDSGYLNDTLITFVIFLLINAAATGIGCLVGYISKRRERKTSPAQEELVESPAE